MLTKLQKNRYADNDLSSADEEGEYTEDSTEEEGEEEEESNARSALVKKQGGEGDANMDDGKS